MWEDIDVFLMQIFIMIFISITLGVFYYLFNKEMTKDQGWLKIDHIIQENCPKLSLLPDFTELTIYFVPCEVIIFKITFNLEIILEEL